jgi:hypothetical protein
MPGRRDATDPSNAAAAQSDAGVLVAHAAAKNTSVALGERRGRWLVIGAAVPSSAKLPRVLVRCDCGLEQPLTVDALRKGSSSCRFCRKHGSHRHTSGDAAGRRMSPTYKSWVAMRQRCSVPHNPAYPRYGGRGIGVCDRWQSFENFLADMGDRPEGMSLDRIDTNGNYEPGNCRWATPKQQARNTRRSRLVTAFGQTKPLSQWAEEFGMHRTTLRSRLAWGWDAERAIREPRSRARRET